MLIFILIQVKNPQSGTRIRHILVHVVFVAIFLKTLFVDRRQYLVTKKVTANEGENFWTDICRLTHVLELLNIC